MKGFPSLHKIDVFVIGFAATERAPKAMPIDCKSKTPCGQGNLVHGVVQATIFG